MGRIRQPPVREGVGAEQVSEFVVDDRLRLRDAAQQRDPQPDAEQEKRDRAERGAAPETMQRGERAIARGV